MLAHQMYKMAPRAVKAREAIHWPCANYIHTASRAVPARHARGDPVQHAWAGRLQAMCESHLRGEQDHACPLCAGLSRAACAGWPLTKHARSRAHRLCETSFDI
ncbi:hypothetical protein PanWU01x14_299740 [Parasponia andersonii]|uniref:Uncharacterized protein n=1 Tax=Parasponia andersonii TaxID=3476 RepID=A0A2P5AU94_PARAD|nr:hypothetical protein PanWU01x14_299740 [Parasponia andersonii]